jgi:large subunit ribosomal protein L17
MAMIELVDYNEIYNFDKQPKKKTTRRSRKRGATKPVTVAADNSSTEEE